MDKGDWQATVHGVTKSRPQLSTHAMPMPQTETPHQTKYGVKPEATENSVLAV